MIKAIIFDFDGVIINSEKIWLKAKIKALKKNNIKIYKKINLITNLGLGSNNFFLKFIPKSIYKKKINNVIREYKIITKKSFLKTPKLNNGILSILKMKNLEFCIVSNNSKNFIIKSLKKHKIFKYFKSKNIVALRRKKFRKPDPFGYKLVLKKLKFKNYEVIVVEDSLTGITAAKKAKIKNIFRFNQFNLPNIKSVKNIINFFPLKKFIYTNNI